MKNFDFALALDYLYAGLAVLLTLVAVALFFVVGLPWVGVFVGFGLFILIGNVRAERASQRKCERIRARQLHGDFS